MRETVNLLLPFVTGFLFFGTISGLFLPDADDTAENQAEKWRMRRSREESSRQPNIILMVSDDMGWHDIGYHGSDAQTPFIDQLAYSGVRLENYHSEATCSPSRGCLMSGYYTFHTGVLGNLRVNERQALPLSFTLLPERMRELGYVTRMVGKWHLGAYKIDYTPTHRGFDSFTGYTGSEESYFSHRECVQVSLPNVTYETCGCNLYNSTHNYYSILDDTNEYSSYMFNDAAVEIINTHDQSKPLFLYFASQLPHMPVEVPENYMQYVSDDVKNEDRRVFDAMAYVLDETVSNVTQALQDNGMWDDTIFIFISDNGGSHIGIGSNYPLRGQKGSMYEGGIRVPAFVAGPLVDRPGTVNYDLIHVTDWYNTIIHLGGGNSTEGDGYNMWPTISNGEDCPRTEVALQINPDSINGVSAYPDIYDTAVTSALIWNQWKIITGSAGDCTYYPPYGTPEKRNITECDEPEGKNVWLYNIGEDMEERYDLTDVYPELVELMLWKLAEYNRTAVYYPRPNPDLLADPRLYDGNWVPWVDPRWHNELLLEILNQGIPPALEQFFLEREINNTLLEGRGRGSSAVGQGMRRDKTHLK